jgi:hypothetical protein
MINILNEYVLLDFFLVFTSFYDMIQFSIINKSINDFFNVNKKYIFLQKLREESDFVTSFFVYFFNFVKSIDKTVNNFLNNNSKNVQNMLSFFPDNNSQCEGLNISRAEFVELIQSNYNYKDIYHFLYCPPCLLFKEVPLIESWYILIHNKRGIYQQLYTYFFDILKYHLYNVKNKNYSLFKRVVYHQIDNSHLNGPFYEQLFDILYEIDSTLFVNELYDFFNRNQKNKDHLDSSYNHLDQEYYHYYIDYTTDDMKMLYNKYNLQGVSYNSKHFNNVKSLLNLIK